MDLSSFASIRAAVEEFKSQSQRLDVLMLNAGIMAVPPDTTKEGFEIQLGTNHYGHFLLTQLLLPTLQATIKLPDSDVRVITLTSEGHNMARTGKTLFSKAEQDKCGAWIRYGYSKLANVLFARELARRYPDIISISLHPGMVGTDLFKTTQKNNIFVKMGLAVASSLLNTPEQGAMNQVWAASTSRGNITNGAYYKPIGTLSKGSPCAQDAKLAEDFWNFSEQEVKRVSES